MHILIADDEPRSSLLLRKQIEIHFPHVSLIRIVHSFADILMALHQTPPDLLFLDILLHGRSAFDLLDKYPDRHFPVVITSASSEFAFKAFEYGVCGYLLKPINPEDLFRIFKRQNLLFPPIITGQLRQVKSLVPDILSISE